MAPSKARKTASQEQIFLEFVQQIDRHRTGRMALVVTLSLTETARGLQATQNLVCDQIKRHLAGKQYEIFRFVRGDVVVMGKDVPDGLMRDMAFGLIFRLKDESFFELFEDAERDLCRVLNADSEYKELLTYAKMGLRGPVELPGVPFGAEAQRGGAEAHGDDVESEDAHGDHSEPEPEIVTLSAGEFEIYRRGDGFEEDESDAEVSQVNLETCREEVVSIPEKGDPIPVMTLVRADREALIERFLFDADEETAASYTPKILQQAEQQVLSQLAREVPQPETLAIMAQVGTLLCAEFLSFDHARSVAGAWPRSFLIVDRDDARDAAANSFEFAREFVEGRGHELGISGLGFRALGQVRLKAQGFAYQFVVWDAEEAALTTRKERLELKAGAQADGSARTVLTGCDCEEAIEFGQKIGIELFAGRAASAALTHARYMVS